MFTSIRSRMLATYLLLIAVTLGIVTLALVAFLIRNPQLTREAENNLLAAANAVERQSLAANAPFEGTGIATAVEEADQLLDVRILVFLPNGTLAADSRSDSEPALTVPQPETPGRRGANSQVAEATDANGQPWIYLARTFQRGFTLVVAMPAPRAPAFAFFTDELFQPIFRAGLIALLLSLILAFLMTRSITAPLQRVSASAEQLAQGKMQAIDPEGPEELRSLARTFNEMGTRVVATQQSQKDFVANVSHDLKTPLTSIQGFAQAILDGTAQGPESVKKSAQVISDEAARMQHMVQGLLELARLDAGALKLDLQPIELDALVDDVARKFAIIARKTEAKLKVTQAPGLKVMGDYERLAQALSNLLDNALKFSPDHGLVELTTARRKSNVEITVSDSGPGIPPAEAKRIFERFYQTDKSRRTKAGKGTGLGLPIAQQIVVAHGGTIRVESKPGSGSRFIVSLPIVQ